MWNQKLNTNYSLNTLILHKVGIQSLSQSIKQQIISDHVSVIHSLRSYKQSKMDHHKALVLRNLLWN